ncbi:hypothetical protein V2J09_003427, partial [Rumex salicifolius]
FKLDGGNNDPNPSDPAARRDDRVAAARVSTTTDRGPTASVEAGSVFQMTRRGGRGLDDGGDGRARGRGGGVGGLGRRETTCYPSNCMRELTRWPDGDSRYVDVVTEVQDVVMDDIGRDNHVSVDQTDFRDVQMDEQKDDERVYVESLPPTLTIDDIGTNDHVQYHSHVHHSPPPVPENRSSLVPPYSVLHRHLQPLLLLPPPLLVHGA